MQNALSSGYDIPTLQRMVRFRLNRDLFDYAAPTADKQDTIFRLIEAAERQGFLTNLVHAARSFNPGNAKLATIAHTFGLDSLPTGKVDFQRIIDEARANLDPVKLRRSIFEAESRVCSISIKKPRSTVYGTGFLVATDLVITNCHVVESVISGDAQANAVTIRFDYKQQLEATDERKVVCKLARDWCVVSSEPGDLDEPAPNELDYAILQLEDEPPPVRDDQPRGFYQLGEQPQPHPDSALFIMQHPRGRATELAMDFKAVIGPNKGRTRVHYRTNTEPGSSGSPCFSSSFEVVALHQAGDPDFDPAHKPAYNQGVPVAMIAADIKARGYAGRLGIV